MTLRGVLFAGVLFWVRVLAVFDILRVGWLFVYTILDIIKYIYIFTMLTLFTSGSSGPDPSLFDICGFLFFMISYLVCS